MTSDVTQRSRAHQYQAWLEQVAAAPYRYDFYQTMRRIASAHPHLPPLGEALRPQDEPVRVGQPAEFDFAPAPLHQLRRRADLPPLLLQRIFGLLGSNGPLPLHLSEHVRDRSLHHADPTLQRFLDTLTHRFALLFYRAWAEAQPAVSLDRSANKAYFNRLGSLVGIGLPSLQDRDALPDASKLFFAGRLSRQTRDADGLLAWLRIEFDVPVAIEQWCGHWMPLQRAERSRLGRRSSSQLGRSTVLGASVWDVQHKFRITMGPLTLDQYERFLPGGTGLARLQSLVRNWAGIEFDWDLKLILGRAEVPRFALAPAAAQEPAEQAPIAEGSYDVELVDVNPIATESGERIGLRFRITSGLHQGMELTETAAANASSHGKAADLLRRLGASGADVSVAAARELVGRRCAIAVHQRRNRNGSRPVVALGRRTGLGFTTWLGQYLRTTDPDDLRIDVERPRATRPT